MADVLGQIEEALNRSLSELAAVEDLAALEQFRIKYLGTKGEVKNLTNLIGQAPKEQKREVGQKVNAAKNQVESAFEIRKSELSSGGDARDAVDGTEPGKRPAIGNRHTLMTGT